MKNQTLFLVRGLPGSGKSSLYDLLEFDGIKLEADMYFMKDGIYQFDASKLSAAHQWCQNWTTCYLNNNLNVMVTNTSTTEKEVETYRQIAENTNSNFVSLILENRHQGVNIHGVPEEKLKKIKQRFSVKL